LRSGLNERRAQDIGLGSMEAWRHGSMEKGKRGEKNVTM